MKILVTGAKGFVGRNLCLELANIRDGKSRCWGEVSIEKIYEYDIDSTPGELEEACSCVDFVFNLAGVNRPQNADEFMKGNFGFASTLLDTLKKYGNRCPVMLSSSQQASLSGRFGNSEYGRSKKAGEDLFLDYSRETGAPVKIFRFPNLFGKWCRPNYNSAVATFCNAVANDLPYTVNDPSVELELLYIDDLIAEMIACLKDEEHRCEFDGLNVIPCAKRESPASAQPASAQGRYCYCPVTHKATLGEIVELLKSFNAVNETHTIPDNPKGSFANKLYATFLSYLPERKMAFTLKMNTDARGSFTELLHSVNAGQISINISKPGITKGEHWHHTKWEMFIVVKGHGLIRERKLGTGEIIEFEVSGDEIKAVQMLPGYTHSIVNLSDTEDLVTVMWANESHDPEKPDTYREFV